jgi:hypothetical protein
MTLMMIMLRWYWLIHTSIFMMLDKYIFPLYWLIHTSISWRTPNNVTLQLPTSLLVQSNFALSEFL